MAFWSAIFGMLFCFSLLTGCQAPRPKENSETSLPRYMSDLQDVKPAPPDLQQRIARFTTHLHQDSTAYTPVLDIVYPLDGTIFPPEIAAPTVIWVDPFLYSKVWLVLLESESGKTRFALLTDRQTWTPDAEVWDAIKAESVGKTLIMTIMGLKDAHAGGIVTKTRISLQISKDPLGSRVFYRQVPPVFVHAHKNPQKTVWRLGDISSYAPPRVVLKDVPVCGNCHSFSRNGSVMGMDLDFRGDRGGYALLPVTEEMQVEEKDYISWNDCCQEDKMPSMGLFSRVSPNGRFVVSTVYEKNLMAMINNIDFSQLFLTLKGRLAIYDRFNQRFFLLPGADHPDFVQTNPAWSPNGKEIVFSRAKVDDRLVKIVEGKGFTVEPDTRIQDLNKSYQIQYDLYRIPFNSGNGGQPVAIKGASYNGKSNYCARYSPDGKWIVFTQSQSGILLQPDSKLFILPAEGGAARQMNCNKSLMNSWHSWSPNSRWLVFASKAHSPFTELFLTHIDASGNDAPPVRLTRFNSPELAANIPELVAFDGPVLRQIALIGH